MNRDKEIYEFAASAGALEGYLFLKKDLEAASLDNWVRNLYRQYANFPDEIRACFQGALDRTLGRAVRSLVTLLGDDHVHVSTLRSMIKGALPDSAQDFEQEKKEKLAKFGTS